VGVRAFDDEERKRVGKYDNRPASFAMVPPRTTRIDTVFDTAPFAPRLGPAKLLPKLVELTGIKRVTS